MWHALTFLKIILHVALYHEGMLGVFKLGLGGMQGRERKVGFI